MGFSGRNRETDLAAVAAVATMYVVLVPDGFTQAAHLGQLGLLG